MGSHLKDKLSLQAYFGQTTQRRPIRQPRGNQQFPTVDGDKSSDAAAKLFRRFLLHPGNEHSCSRADTKGGVFVTASVSLRLLKQIDAYGLGNKTAEIIGKLGWR